VTDWTMTVFFSVTLLLLSALLSAVQKLLNQPFRDCPRCFMNLTAMALAAQALALAAQALAQWQLLRQPQASCQTSGRTNLHTCVEC